MAAQDMGSEIKMNHYILCRRKSSTIPKISYLGIVAGQRKRFRGLPGPADCIQVYHADCIQIYVRVSQDKLSSILYFLKNLQYLKISV